MNDLPFLDHAALAELAQSHAPIDTPCQCTKTPLDGWASLPNSLPDDLLEAVGTLMALHDSQEPTYNEYHPGGTSYWAVNAPIAPRYFPYNRANVCRCRQCARLYLRYQEGGGYFVDQRIRLLNPALIVNAPLDNE
ncbi:hypothetical protein [Pandoraea apista]|uniref:hypothetical protein n=1 Tax=Pandoraea apista TaxID=93218 RepID=UPI0006588EF7|nr:hypothetical protein [Pandoraea apista]ALS64366.1 hypothetical protein AT395_04535 [Pandoraea apista]RRW99436.1 hypothetical protein EGJ54_01255 [Pandoraea apista]RRX07751.1 hypothetical protein EGJ56_01050 [Pandoraea apista]CFB64017.1 hypothetical protein LMG16407_04096 [Pandoraea apista]